MAILLGLPATVLLGVLVGWPIVNGIVLSLQRITPTAEPGWVGLHNYEAVLTSGTFWESVRITVVFSLAALIVEFTLGFGLSR